MRKHLFIAALIIFGTTDLAVAQDNPLCGKIESGSLTIPSYRFEIVDSGGKPLDEVKATAWLQVDRAIWQRAFLDGYWSLEPRTVRLPIKFSLSDGLYVSFQLSKMQVKNTGNDRYPCYDKLRRVYFEFVAGSQRAGYGIDLYNSTPAEVALPDSSKPIRMILRPAN